MSSAEMAPPVPPKNLVSIAEEGSHRYAHARPHYAFHEMMQPESSVVMFVCRVAIGHRHGSLPVVVGEGTASRKKTAAQLAVGCALLTILETEHWRMFPFGTDSCDEAVAFVKNAMASLHTVPQVQENPVGDLAQLCRKRGLPEPNFETTQDEGGGVPSFSVHCFVAPGLEALADGRSKRQAKASACKNLLQQLLGDPVVSVEAE